MACPVFDTLNLVGKKWTFIIIQEIALHDNQGFNFISKRVKNISPKVLAQRLHDLESQNIIEKNIVSNKIVYVLTNKGKELQNLLTSFALWSKGYNVGLQCEHTTCVDCTMLKVR